jgi:predicted transcriptional regulator
MRLKDLETWLTPADIARLLGISRQAVHKQLEEGKYERAIKTRGGWLVDPEAAERVAAERSNNVQAASRPSRVTREVRKGNEDG